jgi:hypothetical protein
VDYDSIGSRQLLRRARERLVDLNRPRGNQLRSLRSRDRELIREEAVQSLSGRGEDLKLDRPVGYF